MKKLFFIGFLVLSVSSFSQEIKKQFIHKGLLRSTATFAIGGITQIALHGNLEYYLADNVSLRGSTFLSLKMFDPHEGVNLVEFDPFLVSNHQILFGAFYHFKTKNHFDPYLGFQPGVAVSQAVIYYSPPESTYSAITVNPIMGLTLGFNLYFQKFFHLFAETQYIHGKHLSDSYKPVALDELRFSFGLGFNLSVFKPKSTTSTSN
jgi:hypothetical protein